MKSPTALCHALLLLLAMLCPACTNSLAELMVAAPNNRLHSDAAPAPAGVSEPMAADHFMLPVGPPTASLAVWVMEPKNVPVRGTIIVLHGFLSNHHFVRDAADEFCKAGFRCVLPDLRGHGESTGNYITYGVAESHDLAQLTDYLHAHHLAGDSIGVYGTSLGAAVAIQYAAIDPRVSTVVAVAPFATLTEEAPHFGRTLLPMPGMFLSDAQYAAVMKEAGTLAHFDPKGASPLAAITRTKAKILLIHGAVDFVIPTDQSRQLHAASPESELVILPVSGHLAACLDLTGNVPRLAREFMDKHPPKS